MPAPRPGCPPARSRSPARRLRYGSTPSRPRLLGPTDRLRYSPRPSRSGPDQLVADQVFLIVPLSISTFSFGAPPPASLNGGPKPRLPTFWRIFKPLTTWPNGV